MKFCNKCKCTKPVSDFDKNKSSKDGLHNYCKICKSEYGNKDKNKIKAKRWIGKNMKKYLLIHAKYRVG